MSRARKPRLPRMRPPCNRSARIYLRLPRQDVARLRFLLEAHDNLGLVSVLDRWEAVVTIIHSPDQTAELREALERFKDMLPLEVLTIGDESQL